MNIPLNHYKIPLNQPSFGWDRAIPQDLPIFRIGAIGPWSPRHRGLHPLPQRSNHRQLLPLLWELFLRKKNIFVGLIIYNIVCMYVCRYTHIYIHTYVNKYIYIYIWMVVCLVLVHVVSRADCSVSVILDVYLRIFSYNTCESMNPYETMGNHGGCLIGELDEW